MPTYTSNATNDFYPTEGMKIYLSQDYPTSIITTSATNDADNYTINGYTNNKLGFSRINVFNKEWVRDSSYLIQDLQDEPLDSRYISKVTYNYGQHNEFQITGTIDTNTQWIIKDTTWTPLSPIKRLQQIIQQRLAPTILIRRRSPLLAPKDEKEIRARQSLRWLIGEKEFRRLLKHGFISVLAPSGLVYCISPGHTLAKVYKNGKLVQRLCVQLDGNFPPTDALLMRYLLILNDEEYFRSKAYDHGIYHEPPAHETNQRPLLEIYNELKTKAMLAA